MKKSFIAIIALFTVGVINAQSKSNLLKEFQSLEEKLGKVHLKYDKKLQQFDKEAGNDDVIGEDIKEGDFKDEDFKEFGEGNDDFGGESGMEESMKVFVEMYEDNAKNGAKMYAEFGESKEDKKLAKVTKEYEAETAKIEKKMYEIAKKYLAKK